jgi:putative (di)nucleoside polyphosphate hydrolase
MIKITSLYRPNVGVMVINQAGKVLVCRRSDVDPADNPWQMVQGGVDEGETYLKAGLRELEEETNIKTDEIEMVELWDEFQYYDFPLELKTPYDEIIGQKQKWLIVKYLDNENTIDLSKAAEKEFDDYKWVSIAEAVGLIWKPKKAIYKRLAERYKAYLTA